MKELTKNVKQNKRATLVLCVVAIIAFILCIAAFVTTNAKQATAAPSASIQETLDQTSTAYFDALSAQQEAQANVNEANAKIEYCNEKIPEVQAKLAGRFKQIYMNGTGNVLDLVLGASTVNELVNNIEVLTIMSNKDSAMIQECQDLRTEVEEQKVSLEENLAEASAQADAAAAAYNQAQAALAAAQAQEEQGGSGGGGGGGGGGGYLPPETGNAIADRALGEQGKPYIWGAVGPGGYDCSGLVSYAVSGAHIRLGTTTTFMGWPRLSSPQTGCICTHSSHCGIYISDGMMCHAPTTGQVVCCTRVQGGMIYVVRP